MFLIDILIDRLEITGLYLRTNTRRRMNIFFLGNLLIRISGNITEIEVVSLGKEI